jgi:hypothetical protein
MIIVGGRELFERPLSFDPAIINIGDETTLVDSTSVGSIAVGLNVHVGANCFDAFGFGAGHRIYDNCSFITALGTNVSTGTGAAQTVAAGHNVSTGASSRLIVTAGEAIIIGTSILDACVLGHTLVVDDTIHDVILVGHSNTLLGGNAGSTKFVMVGSNITVGGGTGIHSSNVHVIGDTITVGGGAAYTLVIGNNLVVASNSQASVVIGNFRTFNESLNSSVVIGTSGTVGRLNNSVVIGYGHNISTLNAPVICIGNVNTIAPGHGNFGALVIGDHSTSTATLAYSIALGFMASAGDNEFVVGHSDPVTSYAAMHKFIVRGFNVAGNTNIDTINVIDNPADGSTGLTVVYNSAGTFTNKTLLASTSPPAGSLLAYFAP